jgi:glycosyltransferase involved in cell wall biosynthesis
MKVLIISAAVGKSPSEIVYSFVFDEIVRLAKRGIEVHVARLRFEGSGYYHGIYFHDIKRKAEPKVLYEAFRKLRYFPTYSLLRNPKKIYGELLYSLNIEKVAQKVNPDIIHAHFAYPEGWVGILAKKVLRTKIPLVLTSHGYDLNIVKEYNYGLRIRKSYDAIIRKTLKEVDHIIVPSKLLFLRAIEGGAEISKISLIPNGVDLKIFDPQKYDSQYFRRKHGLCDSKIILTVRALKKYYGIDTLIKVATILPEDLNVKFVIIGKVEDKNLLQMAGHIVGRKIIVLGSIPRNEIPYAIAAADIIVDPCPIGQGINVLEAMAMAKPVIGMKTRLWDYIIDGYNGFLVSPGDAKALAEKILYLLENPLEAKRMGLNGRKLAEEKFDIEKRIDKIISIYKALIER